MRNYLSKYGIPGNIGELKDALVGSHGALRLSILALVRFQADQAPIRAAALTYTTLLSIVPILAFSFAILRGLGFDQGIYEYILEQLGPVFNSEVREKLFTFVDKVNFKTMGATGLGAFLVTIVLTLNAVERSLNVIFDVKQPRALTRRISDYFSMIFFTPLLLGIIISATTLFKMRDFLASFGSFWFLSTGAEILLKMIPLVGSIILISLMIIVMPNKKIHFAPALVGSAVGGVLLYFLQWGYVSLQVGFTGKTAIYGALAQLPILMVWIYLGWNILLYAAEIAALVQGLPERSHKEDEIPDTGLSWEAGLRVMALLARRADTREPLFTLDSLEKKLDYPTEILKNVIYQLRESGLIAETNKGDQLLPARNPSAIAAIEIFDAMESGPTHPGEHPRAEAVIDKMHQGRRTSLEGLTLEILIEDASNDGGAFSISTVEADG
ncbi:MAG: YihY family inner membrane protein [Nitrospinaceae bacterium]|nr:YihY family inner membrane protein [Nitrospinaceae bacterium]MBT3434169.1 YihY family inner membrane protein [Nitrospinaceae bacterium]MBT3821161.1 YihY family inner membrane protein [Nitrospinaceae bacterium]MBT4094060.1 YihY family inner membrane protein [Nitrospinaceae bacterium]MBT4432110.1 YihY family inner membrane protein [Nitrospinaceae bacterium]